MNNPFEPINARLNNLEALTLEVLQLLRTNTATSNPDADPYGDFKWLSATCSGIPKSTLRIHSAAGKIPGVVKFGKRVLYEKSLVLNWLRSQTRQPVDMAEIERIADLQVNAQLRKRSQKEGVQA
ncbi:hypothetical protein [Spirosoma telluris]|uniref:helix-turn-helix transcriptional regulator n=1 Tax=Spirosoma telluris TaxID=2183553 RepID=UPI002FC3458D